MPRVTMIGAGSAGFCRMLLQDALTFDSLKDAHFVLMDVDPGRLKLAHKVMQKMKQQHGLTCTFSATTNRRASLKGSDFVISMIQVGGLAPYELDIAIPLKYGVDQCVGDTINPGGIFRGLRHVPALSAVLADMEEVCPEAIFMNYANPMAIVSWALQERHPDIQSVGLCHGVQHTTQMLCDWLGVPVDDCEILTAGINHMAWFTEFKNNGKDLYPRLWRKLDNEGPINGEEYRFEMMKAAGFFMTESPGHLSEYLPYFRKRRDLQKMFGGRWFSGETAAYLKMCKNGLVHYKKEMKAMASGKQPVPFDAQGKSVEYAANIMNSKLTNQPTRLFGNVRNLGEYIPNLPPDCCVEVPIFVDRLGMHPTAVDDLPTPCAELCLSNISCQRAAVRAALDGDPEAVFQACLLDPLTGAVLAPHEIRNMAEEMLKAQAQWLPQFKGKKNRHPAATIGRIKGKTAKRGKALKRQIGHYD